jgi:DNA polymerase eta
MEWNPSCNLVPLQQDASEESAFKPQDEEDKPEEPKHPITWHDIALSIGAELMFKARNEILQTLGYTTSAVSITRL